MKTGAQLGGRGRERVGEQNCPDFVKNALAKSIFDLNFPFKM